MRELLDIQLIGILNSYFPSFGIKDWNDMSRTEKRKWRKFAKGFKWPKRDLDE